MSTFDGFVREYPEISIDRFLRENHSSTTYFLSHCHEDHMMGLQSARFHECLKERGFSKLYVSSISKMLLVNDKKYSALSPFLEVISLEQPTIVPIPNHDGAEEFSVVVTLLPAGHCPGSVMFFFEGPNGNILYTGDFRIETGGAQRLHHLHYENGRIKPIKTLYLDTTFCDTKSCYFPTRQQSIDAIISLIQPWIEKGSNYAVRLMCPAKYGYESIFTTLHESLGKKIHVDHAKYQQYRNVSEIEQSVTVDGNSTQIHACYIRTFEHHTGEFRKIPCGYHAPNGQPVKLRTIKPCAMSFAQNVHNDDIVSYDSRSKIYRVCFPTHSSLTELWDIVSHTEPQALHANVIPERKTEEEVLNLLTPLLKKKDDAASKFQVPLLGILKRTSVRQSTVSSSGSFDFNYYPTNRQEAVSTTREPVKRFQRKSADPITKTSSSFRESSSDSECSKDTVTESSSSEEMDLESSVEVIESIIDNIVTPTTMSSIAGKSRSSHPISTPKWDYSPPSSSSAIDDNHAGNNIITQCNSAQKVEELVEKSASSLTLSLLHSSGNKLLTMDNYRNIASNSFSFSCTSASEEGKGSHTSHSGAVEPRIVYNDSESASNFISKSFYEGSNCSHTSVSSKHLTTLVDLMDNSIDSFRTNSPVASNGLAFDNGSTRDNINWSSVNQEDGCLNDGLSSQNMLEDTQQSSGSSPNSESIFDSPEDICYPNPSSTGKNLEKLVENNSDLTHRDSIPELNRKANVNPNMRISITTYDNLIPCKRTSPITTFVSSIPHVRTPISVDDVIQNKRTPVITSFNAPINNPTSNGDENDLLSNGDENGHLSPSLIQSADEAILINEVFPLAAIATNDRGVVRNKQSSIGSTFVMDKNNEISAEKSTSTCAQKHQTPTKRSNYILVVLSSDSETEVSPCPEKLSKKE